MAPSKHEFFSYTHAGLLFLYRTEIDNGAHSILLFFSVGWLWLILLHYWQFHLSKYNKKEWEPKWLIAVLIETLAVLGISVFSPSL